MLTWIGVALLGGAGALLRFQVASATGGVLVVNLSGSLALGLLVGAGVGGDALLLAGGGLLGSYTTFSTWMLEAHDQRVERRLTRMWLNLGASLLLGLAAAALGRAIA